MDPVAAYTAHSVREINDLLTEVRVTIPRAAGRLAELITRVMVDEYNRGLTEGIDRCLASVDEISARHQDAKESARCEREVRGVTR